MAVRMNPYIVTNGNGREAIAFYEQALEAQVMGILTFGEMPADPEHVLPEDVSDRIMHAHLKIGETDLMLSDTFPGMPFQTGNHVTIALVTDDADRSNRPYGQVTDRFGVPWQITTEAKA